MYQSKIISVYFIKTFIFTYLLLHNTISIAIMPAPYTAKFSVSLSYNGDVEISPSLEEKLLDEDTTFDRYTESDLGYLQHWTEIVGSSDLNVLGEALIKKHYEFISYSFAKTFDQPQSTYKAKAHEIKDIEMLKAAICQENYVESSDLTDNLSILVFFLCPTGISEVKHFGRFAKQQITLFKVRISSFVIEDIVSQNIITINNYFQRSGEKRIKYQVNCMLNNNKEFIFPEIFFSGRLLNDDVEVGAEVDVSANLLTPPPSFYLPSIFRRPLDRSVFIPTENEKDESHIIRKFELSFRIDDASINVIPLIDSLSADIFLSGRFISQVYGFSFRIHLLNLGIAGSGYIDVSYNRVFDAQERERKVEKRAATNMLGTNTARKMARLSRFQTGATGAKDTTAQNPVLMLPVSTHAPNKIFQGEALSCGH